jgi:hypothetical protein
MESRWVALFAREKTHADAETKAREWLTDARSRVVKVTQNTEVVWENHRNQETGNRGQGSEKPALTTDN